ncbi:MAG: hypothetical protein JO354_09160 [Verrucomicrobia bacterium]|nr:hypothetical protein [Verrucomicrobiota bacterium]
MKDCRVPNAEWRVGIMLLLLLMLLIHSRAFAQNIELKTGQVIETTGLRASGDMVMAKVTVGETTGEVGYPISQIAKIDFPEPRALQTARDLLTQGQAEKAVEEIEPIIRYYAPYKLVAGSWWAPAALVKVSALAVLKRDREAEALAEEVRVSATSPEIARAAELRTAAGLIRKQQLAKAAQICDAAIHESTDESVLADAWTTKGDVLAAQRQWDAALVAYLHVPVFYREQSLFMPAAMLGSARAFHHIDDNARARREFGELIESFPKSAEASIAQKELAKLPR